MLEAIDIASQERRAMLEAIDNRFQHGHVTSEVLGSRNADDPTPAPHVRNGLG